MFPNGGKSSMPVLVKAVALLTSEKSFLHHDIAEQPLNFSDRITTNSFSGSTFWSQVANRMSYIKILGIDGKGGTQRLL